MARERKVTLVLLASLLSMAGCGDSSPKDCRVTCPLGTTIDETTCGCTQDSSNAGAGRSVDAGGE